MTVLFFGAFCGGVSKSCSVIDPTLCVSNQLFALATNNQPESTIIFYRSKYVGFDFCFGNAKIDLCQVGFCYKVCE